jgi:hypothetical protein
MKHYLLAFLVSLSTALPALAQNAGGKGFDPVAQAAFDRQRDIERIAGEISRLLTPYQRNEEAPLTTAVRLYVDRFVREQFNSPIRTGGAPFMRLVRAGLDDEAKAFKFRLVEGANCVLEGDVGASSPGRPGGEICFKPSVLARDFYEENLRRQPIPTADRLLAAAIHELAHNLGEQHGRELEAVTYLVAHTAQKGWSPSNISKNPGTVNLSVSPFVYVQFGAESHPCLKKVLIDGREIPRGTSDLIRLGVVWDQRSESWFTPGYVTLQSVTFKIGLEFEGDTPGTHGGCHVDVRFNDSEGRKFIGYQGMITNVNLPGDPWTIQLTQ